MTGERYVHAVHTWMFGARPLPLILKDLDAVGFAADLSLFDHGYATPEEVLRRKRAGELLGNIPVCTAMFSGRELDLSNPELTRRKHTLAFAWRCMDAAAELGCDRMLVSPSGITTGHAYWESRERDWETAVQSLREIGLYAGERGLRLMIEPINRYRVALVHTVDEALRMAEETGLENVGVVADVFHMCMEETEGVEKAIERCGNKLLCLHIGGQTRQVPGRDCLDWRSVLAALDRIGYSGVLSYEPVKLYFEEARVAEETAYREAFLNDLRDAKGYLENIATAKS